MTGSKPDWLKVAYEPLITEEVRGLLDKLSLNTVCKEANCPNMGECYRHRTATFMILGTNCTRNCRFCNVHPGKPAPIDPEEPRRLAAAAEALGLKHAVITCVTRDDLADGGAGHFADCIRALRALRDTPTIEVLVSDFLGDTAALDLVLREEPEVLNHNIETVPSLYAAVRPQAVYARSLGVLRHSYERRGSRTLIKSGFMLGLGETDCEVEALLDDLRLNGAELVTIGQYLRPSREHAEMKAYVTPEKFAYWRRRALDKGFFACEAGPLARSSYRAEEAYREGLDRAAVGKATDAASTKEALTAATLSNENG